MTAGYAAAQEGLMFSAKNELFQLVNENKAGTGAAICSVCSANAMVVAAAIRHCKKTGKPLLIESTANQVNQSGGYTGMTPDRFRAFVLDIAMQEGFDAERIIFGGDHLGPLVWAAEDEQSAMAKAEELVAAYVKAGFSKIHLDCSMLLGSDDPDAALDKALVAKRAARLAEISEKYRTTETVYVIGSEVPIPGGATGQEDKLEVTTPAAMAEEFELFRSAFEERGLTAAWERVIAIVVQPGVEFGDNQVFMYNPQKAVELVTYAKTLSNIVLEGHSTDYQPIACLNAMKKDGIAILKVGPALTFALRSAVFSLEHIEQELLPAYPELEPSRFSTVLDHAMLSKPKHWNRHYSGNEKNWGS